MASENAHKIKLLKLIDLLRENTCEDSPMKTKDIMAKLSEMGIDCTRKTLADDIRVLNNYGYEIMSKYVGHSKGYYVEERVFDIPELKILIDAVQAANFITEKKTAALIDKIAGLGGPNHAEILKGHMICFNNRKHSNESILYNVGFIEEAIRTQRKITFYYYDLDENKEKIYRKNKKLYKENPIALVFSEENYYVMCYSSKYRGKCVYRIDRMDNVQISDKKVVKKAIIDSNELSSYTEQVFKMYSGEAVEVELEFSNELIGVIYDKFGEDTVIKRKNSNTCTVKVRVQESPTFWGWLFQFPGSMKIKAPKELVKKYREWGKKKK